MKFTTPLITLTLICALASTSWAVAGKTRARLDKGELITSSKKVPGSEFPQSVGLMVIDAPARAIWNILERCGDYKRTMQRVKYSKEISRKGSKVRCEVVIDMPTPLDDLRTVTDAIHTVIPGKKWVRSWNMIEGDFKTNTGSWTLMPFNEQGSRTLVIYKVHAVPKTAVPDMVIRLAQKKALPKALEHLRSRFKKK
jgi:hypothetical protein